jgi:hypothetical protein
MYSKNREKTVVFVGGVDFSGTTYLDLLLGRADNVRSVGEVRAIFRPTHISHLYPKCSCGTKCDMWNNEIINTEDNLYSNIFDKFPDIDFIIDSSKSIPWIVKQSKRLLENGYNVKHVLIWKTLEHFLDSCQKRKKNEKWAIRKWTLYHEVYSRSISEKYVIALKSILKDRNKEINKIYNWLNIKYNIFEDINVNKVYHIAFGSATARLSLFEKGSVQWTSVKQSSLRTDINNSESTTPKCKTNIDRKHVVKKNSRVQDIEKCLSLKNGPRKSLRNDISSYIMLIYIYIKEILARVIFKVKKVCYKY